MLSATHDLASRWRRAWSLSRLSRREVLAVREAARVYHQELRRKIGRFIWVRFSGGEWTIAHIDEDGNAAVIGWTPSVDLSDAEIGSVQIQEIQ